MFIAADDIFGLTFNGTGDEHVIFRIVYDHTFNSIPWNKNNPFEDCREKRLTFGRGNGIFGE
jgi:hypothetical protein